MQERILSIANSVVSAEIKGLEELRVSLGDSLIQVVEAIIKNTGKLVLSGVGKSAYIAGKIQSTFVSVGKPAVFLHPTEAAHGDLGLISPDDLVILVSNSGNTSELAAVIKYCVKQGITLIGMTSNKDSELGKVAQITLLLPKVNEGNSLGAPTISTTLALCLGDILATNYIELQGITKEQYKQLHPGGSIGNQLMRVSEVMHKGAEMPLVPSGTPAMQAILEISNKRLGCTGVVNKAGNLLGVMTDGDLRRHINNLANELIDNVMTKNPIALQPDILVHEAIALMNAKAITNAFVLEANGLPVGIVHIHDLLRLR